MKAYVVFDTSFIVATIDNSDSLHNDAVFLFREISNRKEDLQVIVPPLVIYEVIVTLRRKGVSAAKLESIILRFVNLSYVTVLSLSELSALKHANSILNSTDPAKALRTQDFMIMCVAEEFTATAITFDIKLWKRCKPVYKATYYCSTIGNMSDELIACLQNIDTASGKDITKITYLPF